MDTNLLQTGGRACIERIRPAVTAPDGTLHPQSLLCAAGAVTGAACRKDVWDIWVSDKGVPADQVFRIVRSKTGEDFFFGELLDEMLLTDKYSPVSMAGAACVKGGERLPDMEDIMRYISLTAGTERFGRVRSCETGEDILTYSRQLRGPMFALAGKYAPRGQLHAVLGAALQQAVWSCRAVMNVREAARIALESAAAAARQR